MEAFKKNEKHSVSLRSLGNKEYRKGNFFESLRLYNKSLCYAKKPETLSLCYANRSAVYLSLDLYDHCLTNIRKARDNYPKEMMKKLEDRGNDCMDKYMETLFNTKERAVINDFLELSYPPNPKFPFVAECLELKENEKFGRHVITNRDLKAGDIIAITPNVYNVIEGSACYTHCSFCLRSNDMNLLPCDICPNAMYCSRRCMKEDADELHYGICNKKPDDVSGVYRFLERMVKRSDKIFRNSHEEFLMKIEKNPEVSIFDIESSDFGNPMFCKDLLLAAFIDESKLTFESFCEKQVLMHSTTIQKNQANEFYSKVSRNFASAEKYVEFVNHFTFDDEKFCPFDMSQIGFSLHPLRLMFNTSCNPNLHTIVLTENCVTVWIIKHPVKAGEQLFLRYQTGNEWFFKDKSQRQEMWMETFGFRCECEACVNDWKRKKDEFLTPNFKLNLELYRNHCDYFNKHYATEYPSTKMLQMEIDNEMFLQQMSKPIVWP